MHHMDTQFPLPYSNHQWHPYQPPMHNLNSWTPWTQPPNQQTSWSPGWRNYHPGNQFPHNQSPQQFPHQQFPPQQYPQPYQQYQQPQLQIHNNVAPNMPIRPQLPTQPNPNPNNKEFLQVETANMPAYSIIPVPCNDIRLRSGRVVEPLVIEDVPSAVSEERMSQHYLSNIAIRIIEDVENPVKISAETQEETSIDTQPTQLVREPPYPERLILLKAVGQPQFNLL